MEWIGNKTTRKGELRGPSQTPRRTRARRRMCPGSASFDVATREPKRISAPTKIGWTLTQQRPRPGREKGRGREGMPQVELQLLPEVPSGCHGTHQILRQHIWVREAKKGRGERREVPRGAPPTLQHVPFDQHITGHYREAFPERVI